MTGLSFSLSTQPFSLTYIALYTTHGRRRRRRRRIETQEHWERHKKNQRQNKDEYAQVGKPAVTLGSALYRLVALCLYISLYPSQLLYKQRARVLLSWNTINSAGSAGNIIIYYTEPVKKGRQKKELKKKKKHNIMCKEMEKEKRIERRIINIDAVADERRSDDFRSVKTINQDLLSSGL